MVYIENRKKKSFVKIFHGFFLEIVFSWVRFIINSCHEKWDSRRLYVCAVLYPGYSSARWVSSVFIREKLTLNSHVFIGLKFMFCLEFTLYFYVNIFQNILALCMCAICNCCYDMHIFILKGNWLIVIYSRVIPWSV